MLNSTVKLQINQFVSYLITEQMKVDVMRGQETKWRRAAKTISQEMASSYSTPGQMEEGINNIGVILHYELNS